MTAQFNPSGTVTGVNDVPGLPQALTDLHAATDAVAASLAAFRPAPFTRGFTITPDASFAVPGPGISYGAQFSTPGYPPDPKINRWGSALSMVGDTLFTATDLNNYEFYNDPFIILPPAWMPGMTGYLAESPPFMKCLGIIYHFDSAGSVKQINTAATFALGHPSSAATPGAAGFFLDREDLNSSLFAAGDYLGFRFAPGAFLLCPDGATFA